MEEKVEIKKNGKENKIEVKYDILFLFAKPILFKSFKNIKVIK